MKSIIIAFALGASGATLAHAGHVSGYYRSNGVYVAPYNRSGSDGTVIDNYSFKGNTDPYTGTTGTNRYTHDFTSPYFNGTPNSQGRYGHANTGW